MAFVDYQYGAWKKEIKSLIHKRVVIQDKIRYCFAKILAYKEKIQLLKRNLKDVDKQIDDYLARS